MSICASLPPKNVSLDLEARLPGNLEPSDWVLLVEVVGAVRQAVPDASSQPPGTVMQHVLDALRAHSAKAVETSNFPMRFPDCFGGLIFD
jgi:hypothetical protein